MSPPPLEGIDGQGRPPLLHRLLGRRHPANALRELWTLLADAPGPRSVLPEDVTARVAREVYLRSIEEVMGDGTVDEEERAFLRELQARLRIPGEVADNMEQVRRRQLRSRGRWEEETGG